MPAMNYSQSYLLFCLMIFLSQFSLAQSETLGHVELSIFKSKQVTDLDKYLIADVPEAALEINNITIEYLEEGSDALIKMPESSLAIDKIREDAFNRTYDKVRENVINTSKQNDDEDKMAYASSLVDDYLRDIYISLELLEIAKKIDDIEDNLDLVDNKLVASFELKKEAILNIQGYISDISLRKILIEGLLQTKKRKNSNQLKQEFKLFFKFMNDIFVKYYELEINKIIFADDKDIAETASKIRNILSLSQLIEQLNSAMKATTYLADISGARIYGFKTD